MGVRELERGGYFFAGIGPWMLEGRDSLRLQMPLTPIDASALTIATISDAGCSITLKPNGALQPSPGCNHWRVLNYACRNR